MAEPDELRDAPDPLIGTLVHDRYRVLRRVGAGTMGVVYEAEHVMIRRRVALKCLHHQLAVLRPDLFQRFQREAIAAAQIGNEHIVDVLDMGRIDNSIPYIVMEFLEGRELTDEVRKGPMPIARLVHIATQICDGLTAAHGEKIIHRDLKPENIFLVRRKGDADFVKILDFGASKFREPREYAPSLTGTGALIGTPLYMPPEQCRGATNIDHRADLYSLGAILFHALTGRTPFVASDVPTLLVDVCTKPVPDVRQWRADVPEGLANVLKKLLAKKPGERYRDCAEVRAALEPFANFKPAELPATTASRSESDATDPEFTDPELAHPTAGKDEPDPTVPMRRPPEMDPIKPVAPARAKKAPVADDHDTVPIQRRDVARMIEARRASSPEHARPSKPVDESRKQPSVAAKTEAPAPAHRRPRIRVVVEDLMATLPRLPVFRAPPPIVPRGDGSQPNDVTLVLDTYKTPRRTWVFVVAVCVLLVVGPVIFASSLGWNSRRAPAPQEGVVRVVIQRQGPAAPAKNSREPDVQYVPATGGDATP
jgi:serine/threonine-protein kinase